MGVRKRNAERRGRTEETAGIEPGREKRGSQGSGHGKVRGVFIPFKAIEEGIVRSEAARRNIIHTIPDGESRQILKDIDEFAERAIDKLEEGAGEYRQGSLRRTIVHED